MTLSNIECPSDPKQATEIKSDDDKNEERCVYMECFANARQSKAVGFERMIRCGRKATYNE